MFSKISTALPDPLQQSPSIADDDNPFRADFSKYVIREGSEDKKMSAGPESKQDFTVATTADS